MTGNVISSNIMKRKFSRTESGFTLIEVMTAVTILAILATVAFTIVFDSVRRSRAMDREVELNTEAATLMDLMTEDLRGAFAKEGVAPWFLGEDAFNVDEPADRVSFLTTAVLAVSPELPAGAVGEVQYTIVDRDGGSSLFLRREQIPAQTPYDEGGATFEITSRLRSLNIQYSDGEDWFDQWDSQGAAGHEAGKLPRQVRIELVLEEGDLNVTARTAVAPVMAIGR